MEIGRSRVNSICSSAASSDDDSDGEIADAVGMNKRIKMSDEERLIRWYVHIFLFVPFGFLLKEGERDCVLICLINLFNGNLTISSKRVLPILF